MTTPTIRPGPDGLPWLWWGPFPDDSPTPDVLMPVALDGEYRRCCDEGIVDYRHADGDRLGELAFGRPATADEAVTLTGVLS